MKEGVKSTSDQSINPYLDMISAHHRDLPRIVLAFPREKVDFLEQFVLVVFKLPHCSRESCDMAIESEAAAWAMLLSE